MPAPPRPGSASRPRRLGPVNPTLALARLLGHTADAVQAVRAGRSLNDALARCPDAARPGTQALSFQVLRLLGTAMALRSRLVAKPPPPALDSLLLCALALLLPESAVGGASAAGYAPHTLVDQAVEAARQRKPGSAGFVNAVLRRFEREKAALLAAVANDPVARHNHPAWWIDRLRADWPDRWQQILAANNRRPPMTLRVNLSRGSVADYLARLDEAGLAGQPIACGHESLGEPAAIVLETPVPVQRLPGFDRGDVSVQDAAAQLAARLLLAGSGLPAGARVLDACAAPGGKTAQLLEQGPAALRLLALDQDPERLLRVDQTLRRVGLAAHTLAADASRPDRWWDGEAFDAILLDAPCSASGIVRRHPDIRWLRRASDIAALAQTQALLLDALWPLLAPGGRLVYCTCSVFRAEGQAQIDAFLQRQADARQPQAPASPGHLLPLVDNPDSAPGLPSTASDGFFHALLTKER